MGKCDNKAKHLMKEKNIQESMNISGERHFNNSQKAVSQPFLNQMIASRIALHSKGCPGRNARLHVFVHLGQS